MAEKENEKSWDMKELLSWLEDNWFEVVIVIGVLVFVIRCALVIEIN